MYYVIKKQPHSTTKCFIGFEATKYFLPKSSDNIIIEFIADEKAVKKWINKDEIILLTEDKKLYIQTMEKFKEVEEMQQRLVDDAAKKLALAKENFTQTINAQLNNFNANDYDNIPLK